MNRNSPHWPVAVFLFGCALLATAFLIAALSDQEALCTRDGYAPGGAGRSESWSSTSTFTNLF